MTPSCCKSIFKLISGPVKQKQNVIQFQLVAINPIFDQLQRFAARLEVTSIVVFQSRKTMNVTH